MRYDRVPSPQLYQHPQDAAALNTLRRVPGIPGLVGVIFDHIVEPAMYVQNVANSVQVGPRQYPRLYDLLRSAVAAFEIENEPILYVALDPRPNALTIGIDKVMIVLSSALLDLLSEEEVLYALGHELGHVASEHIRYHTAAQAIRFAIETGARVSIIGAGLFGLSQIGLLALLDWDRKSELTCDRAGLLLCRNPKVAIGATMKLAGGARQWQDETSTDAFLEQAVAYREADKHVAGRLFKILAVLGRSHPWAVERARELQGWAGSDAYESLLAGRFLPVPVRAESKYSCMMCGNTYDDPTQPCPQCGFRIERVSRRWARIFGRLSRRT